MMRFVLLILSLSRFAENFAADESAAVPMIGSGPLGKVLFLGNSIAECWIADPSGLLCYDGTTLGHQFGDHVT